MIINLDLNQAIQQIFVFMLYQNLSSILKAVLLLYMLHSLMQVRLSIKSVIGLFFRKLIDRKVPIYLVKILCYWYQHQIMSVRWGCSISKGFNVTNGVRQGGVLSPTLFNVYMDGLSNILNNCTTGGFLGGKRINHMLYADDLCIVRLSSAGLQNLLSICDKHCVSHSITFNVKKSVCMLFQK